MFPKGQVRLATASRILSAHLPHILLPARSTRA